MKIGQSKELKGYQKEYFNENDPDWRETGLKYIVTDFERATLNCSLSRFNSEVSYLTPSTPSLVWLLIVIIHRLVSNYQSWFKMMSRLEDD